MPRSFDIAILGLGSMGAFACLDAARRGASVIGFDRFAPPHDRGSHSGDTRVYREAYAEHPDYVPIAQHAGRLWARFGAEAGRAFLHRSGMLSIGAESSALLRGTMESATRHLLSVQRLTAAEICRRFPAFNPPEDSIGLFEATAGWIDVNSALEFAIGAARRDGAEIRLNTPVAGFAREGSHIRIRTPLETVNAGCVVIAAGAWAGSLLEDLSLPLRVLRKILVWVEPLEPALFQPETFPIFAFADRFFYGFPNLHGDGVKLGIHHDPNAPSVSPDDVRPVEPGETEPVLAEARRYLPAASGRVRAARACLYTMTPDEHFILDRHPAYENVWIAAGFSGHGFKFAPAIGEALAGLALNGSTGLPVEFLRIGSRFAA